MTRAWGIASGVALLIAAGAQPVSAQSFGALADAAQSVDSDTAMAALFWSQTADCGKVSGDMAQRQCKAIAAARKAQLGEATFKVSVARGAISVGDYNDKNRAVSVSLEGCVACEQPLEVGGGKVFVVAGEGAVSAKGGGIAIKPFHTVDIKVKNQPDADRFVRDVGPRLAAELVVKLGSAPKSWKVGGAAGYRLELVGFRLYDPCDGAVHAAKPPSSSLAPDKRFCSGEPVKADEPAPAKVDKKPELPRRLSPTQIRDGLEPARQAARKCFEAYGVPGTARFRITIAGSGEVIGMQEKGDFVGTPTSKCIRQAVKTVTFPASRKARTTIDYPFILR